MATTQVILTFLQQPANDEVISYTINNNGNPLIYDQSVSSVFKQFKSNQESGVVGINALDNVASLDTSYNFEEGFNADVHYIVKQSSGKIIVAGAFTEYQGISVPRICRLNTDGSLDTSFTPPAFNGTIRKVVLDNVSGDTMFVMGDFTGVDGYSRLMYLDADGNTDISFSPVTFNNTINDIHLHFNSTIYAVGMFTVVNGSTRNKIARINLNGSLNGTTFGTGFNGPFDKPACISEQSTGKIIVGGTFFDYNSNSANHIVRITATGTYDGLFDTGGGFSGGTSEYVVRTIYIDSSDNVYCSGSFTAYNAGYNPKLIKLMVDGDVDTAFAVFDGFGSLDQGYQITENSDGNIVVVGAIETYDGTSVSKLVTLNADDGSLTYPHTHSFNGIVRTIYCDTNSMLVGGGFSFFTNVNAIQSQLTIPIGTGLTETQGFTLTNLEAFNTHSDISYSSVTNQVIATYTHDPLDVIIIDGIQDIPGYVEISAVGDNVELGATFILTSSPFFYSASFSGGTVDTAQIDLYIYKGDFIDDLPLTPTYIIIKQIVLTNQDTIYFNVSNYLREFCNVDIDKYMLPAVESIEPISDSNATWLKLTLTTQFSGTTVSTVSSKFLGIDGYGWVEEGVNPAPGKVFITADKNDILRNGQSRFYFSMKEIESFEVRSNEDQTFTPISYSADTLNSTEYIMSHLISPNDTVKWMEYRITYSDEVIIKRFNLLDECFYNPIEIIFKNKHGFLQSLPFQKRSNNSYSIDNKDYTKSTLTPQATYNPRLHTKKTYLTNGERTITLNSGYVSDYFNTSMLEMVHSDEIYMNDGERIVPVVLSDKTWVPKTNLNDKLVQYTMKFTMAQDTINKII